MSSSGAGASSSSSSSSSAAAAASAADSVDAPPPSKRAAVGALIGMFAFNELPRFHHPLFAGRRFELVSRDRFVLLIGSTDPKFSPTATRQLLESLGGAHIETIED